MPTRAATYPNSQSLRIESNEKSTALLVSDHTLAQLASCETLRRFKFERRGGGSPIVNAAFGQDGQSCSEGLLLRLGFMV
jgi:hypothetical protein